MIHRPLHLPYMALSVLMLLGLGATTAQATAAPAATGAQIQTAATTTSEVEPISFVQSASRSANVQAPTIAVPTSAQAGDTLLLAASLGNATAVTVPSGWTLKGDQNASTALRSVVLVRTATASDAGTSVAVKMDAIHKSALTLSVYRGVDAAQPVSATASVDANTSSHTTPVVSVPAGSRVVSFWAERGAATTLWTVPSSLSMRTATYSTGSGRVSAAVADPNVARSGVVNGATATTNATSTRGLNWSIVLQARNAPPAAVFSQNCSDMGCTLDASGSTDADGTIASYTWTFGDSQTGSGRVVTATYAAAGSYSVQLTITDNDGASTTTSAVVTVGRSTVYGMNVSPGTSFTDGARETAAQQISRIVGSYGSLGVAKIFYQGALPATFNTAYEGLVPGKVAAVCFKPDQTALANGTLDASIKRYVDSIPAGWKILLVNWQEPDDEIWVDHRFTAAQHRAATERLIDVVRANPAYAQDRAEVWDVWMGYSLDVGRWQDSAASPRLDGIGWDYYWNKPTTSWSTDPSVALTKMAATTKRIGIKDWGLFETGDNPHENDPTGSGRAAFWKKVYDSSESLGFHYVMYFNAIGTTGDHRILPETAFGGPLARQVKTYMTP